MAPVRVKRKVPPRFPPRFRLPLINSSLLAFRRVLSRIYLASFWKGRLGFGWIVTDTAHTCVAPLSINVASLPQSATSPPPLVLFILPRKSLRFVARFLARQFFTLYSFCYSFSLLILSKFKIFIFYSRSRFLASFHLSCRSFWIGFFNFRICLLIVDFQVEIKIRIFARCVRYRRPLLQWRANPFDSSKLVALRVAGDRDWKLLERSSRLLTRFQRNLVLRQFFHRYFNNASPLYATFL